MKLPKFLAWVDLEATGARPQEDHILEIGMVVTTSESPYEEIFSHQGVCVPQDPDWLEKLPPQVERMHTLNGLLDAVLASTKTVRELELEVINLLYQYGRPHDFMLAGSGCSHYDRPLIKAQMPGFDKWLQHPSLDIGTIRRALRFANREDLVGFGLTFSGADKPHRGLDDIRDHLNEWRHYSAILQDIERL